MKNEVKNVRLTKEVYLEISTDKTAQITAIREEKDTVIAEIGRRIETLKELSRTLKEVKKSIKLEKSALRQDKELKFALTKELSMQNKYAKELNKAFANGEETIDLTRFYTAEEKQKTR